MLPARLRGKELHYNRTNSRNKGGAHEEGFDQENNGYYL